MTGAHNNTNIQPIFDQSSERIWYTVTVADIAGFVVKAYDPEAAKYKTELWCVENPEAAAVDVELMLGHAFAAQPLDPPESRSYYLLRDLYSPVKLITYNHATNRDDARVEVPRLPQDHPRLF